VPLVASNLSAVWQFCGKFLAPAFFAQPRAATSPSRLCRKENLRERLCRQFAARFVGAVEVRFWRTPVTRPKPFAWFGILRRPVRRFARRVAADAAQVLVGTQDLARDQGRLPAIWLKRFTPHAFSRRPRVARARTAFASPQRA
jgi:hypothetical protein